MIISISSKSVERGSYFETGKMKLYLMVALIIVAIHMGPAFGTVSYEVCDQIYFATKYITLINYFHFWVVQMSGHQTCYTVSSWGFFTLCGTLK